MADDHHLRVLDEPVVRGRDANVAAWRGYASNFPAYTISPHQIVERGGVVAVLGHTTGSHLGLPDEEERLLTIIWLAEVTGGKVRSWRLVEDSVERRREFGLEDRKSVV